MDEPITTCGCEQHTVTPDGKTTVFYMGRWWKIDCAVLILAPGMRGKIRNLTKQLQTMRPKFIRMKKKIRGTSCDTCGYPIGNRFGFHDDGMHCGACMKTK